uniref:Receptor ligand binding region domain-containing protein n=1 Tax=Magallana gigas TaxID=29159 RepID=A0A8W8MXD4_MAGGI
MRQILLQYGWRHIAILYDEDEVFFRRVGKNLALDFRQDDILNRPYERPFSKSTVDFSSILTEASKLTRVFTILSQAHQCCDVMYDAYRQKMANGDNVFITIELFLSAHWGHYTKFTDQSYSHIDKYTRWHCLNPKYHPTPSIIWVAPVQVLTLTAVPATPLLLTVALAVKLEPN